MSEPTGTGPSSTSLVLLTFHVPACGQIVAVAWASGATCSALSSPNTFAVFTNVLPGSSQPTAAAVRPLFVYGQVVALSGVPSS